MSDQEASHVQQASDLSHDGQGAEAVATRQSGLGPRLRPLLIMGDGKRSFADLAALTGECESLLDQLVLDGMIELVGSAAAAGADAAPGPTPRE